MKERVGPLTLIFVFLVGFWLAEFVFGPETTADSSTKVSQPAICSTLVVTYPKEGHQGLTLLEAAAYAVVFAHYTEVDSIDWTYVAALTYVEAKYDPGLSSHKKAKGLMQLLEPTARHVADSLGIPYAEERTLWNPLVNMQLGISYYVSMLKGRTETDYIEAARCYIGGPSYKNSDYINEYVRRIQNERKKLRAVYKALNYKE